MKYRVVLDKKAQEDLLKLKRSEPKAYAKVFVLINELYTHPTTGLGKPERLKHTGLANVYSRRITQKHRLVYSVHDDIVTVIVISAYGHYNDK